MKELPSLGGSLGAAAAAGAILLVSITLLSAAGCASSASPASAGSSEGSNLAALPRGSFRPRGTAADAAYPFARFAVISDIHLYSRTLGTEGEAFAGELAGSRKLLVESETILREALRMIAVQRPEFLIVSGDLTKDGELENHFLVREYLSWLEETGVDVFVVPGNHDIMNFEASRYTSESAERVETVTADRFAEIYAEMGYAEALHRDPSSLSYVVEPEPGLWLLSLDTCRYRENRPGARPITAGTLASGQIEWIEGILRQAGREGKAVIAFSHHGIVEHFPGQAERYPEYLVRNYRRVGRLLASYGVRVVFTGHFHAQDITLSRFPSGQGKETFIFDIETGSLVTWPCPIRFVRIEPPGTMEIVSVMVDGPSLPIPEGGSFSGYAKEYVTARIAATSARIMERFGVKRSEIDALSPWMADAYVAHYGGDERSTGSETLVTAGLSLAGRLAAASQGSLVAGLWNDLPPGDNDLTLDLVSGGQR